MYIPFCIMLFFIILMYIASIYLAYITSTKKQMNLSVKSSIRYCVITMGKMLTTPLLIVLTTPITCDSKGNMQYLSNSSCFHSINLIFFILSIIFVLLYVIHSVCLCAFTFSPLMKHHGPFASPSGTFNFFLQLIICVFSIICNILPQKHILQAIIGCACFFLLAFLCVLTQPYYTRLGNAAVAVMCAIPATVGVFAIIAAHNSDPNLPSPLEAGSPYSTTVKPPLRVVFWIMFFLAIAAVAVLTAWMSASLGRRQWLIDEKGRMIQLGKKKKKGGYAELHEKEEDEDGSDYSENNALMDIEGNQKGANTRLHGNETRAGHTKDGNGNQFDGKEDEESSEGDDNSDEEDAFDNNTSYNYKNPSPKKPFMRPTVPYLTRALPTMSAASGLSTLENELFSPHFVANGTSSILTSSADTPLVQSPTPSSSDLQTTQFYNSTRQRPVVFSPTPMFPIRGPQNLSASPFDAVDPLERNVQSILSPPLQKSLIFSPPLPIHPTIKAGGSSSSLPGSRSSTPSSTAPLGNTQNSARKKPEPKLSSKTRKFKLSCEVEPATRFLQVPHIRHQAKYLRFAERIFQSGLKKFPSSASLAIKYALFSRSITHDTQRALLLLRHADTLFPTLMSSWLIYSQTKELEAQVMEHNSGTGHFFLDNEAEMMIQIREAKNECDKALACAACVWMNLSKALKGTASLVSDEENESDEEASEDDHSNHSHNHNNNNNNNNEKEDESRAGYKVKNIHKKAHKHANITKSKAKLEEFTKKPHRSEFLHSRTTSVATFGEPPSASQQFPLGSSSSSSSSSSTLAFPMSHATSTGTIQATSSLGASISTLRTIPVARIEFYAVAAVKHARSSFQLLSSLLYKHPDSTLVMRLFAQLLSSVCHDEEAAEMFLDEADMLDKLEEENGKALEAEAEGEGEGNQGEESESGSELNNYNEEDTSSDEAMENMSELLSKLPALKLKLPIQQQQSQHDGSSQAEQELMRRRSSGASEKDIEGGVNATLGERIFSTLSVKDAHLMSENEMEVTSRSARWKREDRDNDQLKRDGKASCSSPDAPRKKGMETESSEYLLRKISDKMDSRLSINDTSEKITTASTSASAKSTCSRRAIEGAGSSLTRLSKAEQSSTLLLQRQSSSLYLHSQMHPTILRSSSSYGDQLAPSSRSNSRREAVLELINDGSKPNFRSSSHVFALRKQLNKQGAGSSHETLVHSSRNVSEVDDRNGDDTATHVSRPGRTRMGRALNMFDRKMQTKRQKSAEMMMRSVQSMKMKKSAYSFRVALVHIIVASILVISSMFWLSIHEGQDIIHAQWNLRDMGMIAIHAASLSISAHDLYAIKTHPHAFSTDSSSQMHLHTFLEGSVQFPHLNHFDSSSYSPPRSLHSRSPPHHLYSNTQHSSLHSANISKVDFASQRNHTHISQSEQPFHSSFHIHPFFHHTSSSLQPFRQTHSFHPQHPEINFTSTSESPSVSPSPSSSAPDPLFISNNTTPPSLLHPHAPNTFEADYPYIEDINTVRMRMKHASSFLNYFLKMAYDESPLQFESWKNHLFRLFCGTQNRTTGILHVQSKSIGLLDLVGEFASTGHLVLDTQVASSQTEIDALLLLLMDGPLSVVEALKQVMATVVFHLEANLIVYQDVFIGVTAFTFCFCLVTILCVTWVNVRRVIKSRRNAIFQLCNSCGNHVEKRLAETYLMLIGDDESNEKQQEKERLEQQRVLNEGMNIPNANRENTEASSIRPSPSVIRLKMQRRDELQSSEINLKVYESASRFEKQNSHSVLPENSPYAAVSAAASQVSTAEQSDGASNKIGSPIKEGLSERSAASSASRQSILSSGSESVESAAHSSVASLRPMFSQQANQSLHGNASNSVQMANSIGSRKHAKANGIDDSNLSQQDGQQEKNYFAQNANGFTPQINPSLNAFPSNFIPSPLFTQGNEMHIPQDASSDIPSPYLTTPMPSPFMYPQFGANYYSTPSPFPQSIPGNQMLPYQTSPFQFDSNIQPKDGQPPISSDFLQQQHMQQMQQMQQIQQQQQQIEQLKQQLQMQMQLTQQAQNAQNAQNTQNAQQMQQIQQAQLTHHSQQSSSDSPPSTNTTPTAPKFVKEHSLSSLIVPPALSQDGSISAQSRVDAANTANTNKMKLARSLSSLMNIENPLRSSSSQLQQLKRRQTRVFDSSFSLAGHPSLHLSKFAANVPHPQQSSRINMLEDTNAQQKGTTLDEDEIEELKEKIALIKNPLSGHFFLFFAIGVVGLIVGWVLAVVPVIIFLFTLLTFTPTSLAAAIRATSAMQMGYLAQQLVYRDTPNINQAIPLDYVTHSTWQGLEHMSTNWEQIRSLLSNQIDYFININRLLRYGSAPKPRSKILEHYKKKNDILLLHSDLFSLIEIKRTTGRWKELDNFNQVTRSCFLLNESECTPERLGGMKCEFIGFDNLIDILIKYSVELAAKRQQEDLSPSLHEFGYVYRLIRMDVVQGLCQYTEILLNCSVDQIQTNINVVIGCFAAGISLIFICLLIVMHPLDKEVSSILQTNEEIKLFLCHTEEELDPDVKKRDLSVT
ncbi:uncharacterized protein MONOS_15193 [Monocercomonoides exilis]|uniref:uncharacterized protein n=1 Tax=Monocercomonoides exilis TaxID=2049356 RepID=UPI00355972C3|nr:hypothetical protein MONOS_15193 [Monocercomonoides exilis]|eukprot:MONOS_15193.1-p1 / transcript=MONOS_15193.1 / gene=MONOS_15193 / organism=Monocercomonoides_exilis_PA203 / gene_product=unspecified product / transcript_product=unspecified product / location=Mono_scaffold01167:5431-13056(+) / protein_length=2542 / sequence_SO=supercontig / SO=protein_coding / is_pseudo=false